MKINIYTQIYGAKVLNQKGNSPDYLLRSLIIIN